MSSITFPLSHSARADVFGYTAETTFRTKKTSSPTYTSVGIVSELRPRINDTEIDVRNLGSHLIYGRQTAFHSYGMTINCYPFDLPFLKYGSEIPNYTTPSGTQAETLQFVYRYKQAEGTAETLDHYLFFLGCKMNTLELSVSSQGLVEAVTDWNVGEITVPSTSSGLTTPTLPLLSATTTPPISNIDGGNTPFTINSVSYPIKEFRIQWNNNIIMDDFNGSGLVDQMTTGAIEITGSFRTPVGKNLALETFMHDFPQTGVNASYTFKSGVMVVNMTEFKLIADDNPHVSGPSDTDKHSFSFVAKTAALSTS
jgi:hypothetical protein